MKINDRPSIVEPGPEPSKLLTALVVIAWAVAAVIIMGYV